MIYFLLSKRWIFRGLSVTLALFYGISGYLSAHEKLRAEWNCPSGMWINHILHFKLSWVRDGKIPLQLSEPKDQFQGDKNLSGCLWHPLIWDLSILLPPALSYTQGTSTGTVSFLKSWSTTKNKNTWHEELPNLTGSSAPGIAGKRNKPVSGHMSTSLPQMMWLMAKTNISLQTQKNRILLVLFKTKILLLPKTC